MKVVRSTFVDNVSHRPAASTEFGAIRVSENGYLADGFQVGGLKCLPVDRVVVVILPVDKEVVGARPRAVHGEVYAVADAAIFRILNARLG